MKRPGCTVLPQLKIREEGQSRESAVRLKFQEDMLVRDFQFLVVTTRNAFRSFSVLVSVSASWDGRKIFQLRALGVEVHAAALQGVPNKMANLSVSRIVILEVCLNMSSLQRP